QETLVARQIGGIARSGGATAAADIFIHAGAVARNVLAQLGNAAGVPAHITPRRPWGGAGRKQPQYQRESRAQTGGFHLFTPFLKAAAFIWRNAWGAAEVMWMKGVSR